MPLVARDYVNALLPVLAALEPELLNGCVAVFRNTRLRVRKLPLYLILCDVPRTN
jgi:hypothetical protein